MHSTAVVRSVGSEGGVRHKGRRQAGKDAGKGVAPLAVHQPPGHGRPKTPTVLHFSALSSQSLCAGWPLHPLSPPPHLLHLIDLSHLLPPVHCLLHPLPHLPSPLPPPSPAAQRP